MASRKFIIAMILTIRLIIVVHHFLYSHNRHNEFNVNLAFIKGSYNKEKIRGNIAIAAGTYTNANYAAEPGVLKNIYEGNVGLKISKTKNVWIDAGIFSSHIGYESAHSPSCWSLTRSLVAENSPYFESGANGKFQLKQLPAQAQYAPVFAMAAFDYDKDGDEDLLLGGNINKARLRFGKYDANYGVLLKNDGKGNFSYINQQQSGFKLRGDVRSIIAFNNTLLIGINQQALKAYKW